MTARYVCMVIVVSCMITVGCMFMIIVGHVYEAIFYVDGNYRVCVR